MYKKNYRYNNNFTFENIKMGETIKIYFWVKVKKKKKLYSFVGFIILYKKKLHLKLINLFNNELIKMLIPFSNPTILKIYKLKHHQRYISRLNKLYFKKKIHLTEDLNNIKLLLSDEKSWTYNLLYFLVPHYYKIKFYRIMKKKYTNERWWEFFFWYESKKKNMQGWVIRKKKK